MRQAAELQNAANITIAGKEYIYERTIRDKAHAHDSVHVFSHNDIQFVIKEGPDEPIYPQRELLQSGREVNLSVVEEGNLTRQARGYDHPNVIEVIEIVEEKNLYLMPYLPLGDLTKFPVSTSRQARSLANGIIAGVSHEINNGVINGDLGTGNIFIGGDIDTPIALLADFGHGYADNQNEDVFLNGFLAQLPSEIVGGCSLLLALTEIKGDNKSAKSFKKEVQALKGKADALADQLARSKPPSEAVRAFAPEPEGEPPEKETILALKAEWDKLAEHSWLSEVDAPAKGK